jgi:hypothetical protein
MREKRFIHIAALAAVALSIGCASTAPASAQSLGDRFKSLFGVKPETPPPPAPGTTAADNGPSESNVEETCPDVSIRAGASTYTVGVPGQDPVGNNVRYQAVITKTARDCRKGGEGIIAHIGIEGRVIAGPSGAPDTVEVPLRVAVVKGGVSETVITTKAYRTTVAMTPGGSVPFTFVVDDLTYPIPPGLDNLKYIFYVGFDPQALSPQPKARARHKKK